MSNLAGIRYPEWRRQFYEIVKRRYGLDEKDCPTDEEKNVAAWYGGESPSQYADILAENHSLRPLRKGTIW